ncbi:MAG: hypothetical protein H0W78_05275 [Planctomycetes bacterium]|nr:hypothetical protein [Planctomycetota bacterium]
MRTLPLALLCLVATGCGNVHRATPQPPAVLNIPPGPGEWVIVERELPLESLTAGRLTLPYGAGSTGRALKHDSEQNDPKHVVRYQIVFAADPLAAGDRCELSMISFQIVHADGSITESPAKGHVVDNSDRREGFRAELSTANRKQLAIPGGATATTHFAEAISLPTR